MIDFGRENAPGDPPECEASLLYGPNLWPAGMPGLRESVEAYYAAMLEASNALLRAFALALALPEAYFLDKFDRAAGALRLLHYPPRPAGETRLGVGAHTDYEFFTILAQDGNPGLQVLNGAGRWIDIPPVAGTFVVNIGDLMARWTNGPLHLQHPPRRQPHRAEPLLHPLLHGLQRGHRDPLPRKLHRPRRPGPLSAGAGGRAYRGATHRVAARPDRGQARELTGGRQ